MKKPLLSAALLLSAVSLQAQNSLHKLVDSVGSDWHSLLKFEDKLYLQTHQVGGIQYEIDRNTHVSTPVADFPFTNGQFTYETICHDFVVLNNKVSKVMKPSTSNDRYLVVADNNNYDTLLSVPDYFSDIKKVGNFVFITSATNVYYSDFTPAGTIKLDTFAGGPGQYFAGSNYYYYVRRDPANSTVRDIIMTNGTTSTVLETVNDNNYYIDFIGEQNGEFYYAVTLNSTNPTITLKKSTSTIPTTVVNTFNVGGAPSYVFTNSSVSAAGLGKLFIMIKSSTQPYPVDLYAYDIAGGTFTKLTDAVNNNVTYSSGLNKMAFSNSYFYFYTTGFYKNLWKTDGTIANTSLYADSVDIRFYDPENNYFTLPTTGIFCDDYPIAGISTEPTGSTADVEYHYGTSTGLVKYNLNTMYSAYPKDFVKFNDTIYFLATETANQYGKQSLYEVDGCGMPTGMAALNQEIQSVSIMPNPSEGDFIIAGKIIDANTSVKVYNMQGQQVHSLQGASTGSISVKVQNLPSGMYIVEIKSAGQAHYEKISIR